jgi:hypothetical protein
MLIAVLDLPVAADLKEVSFSWSEIIEGKPACPIKNLDASNTWTANVFLKDKERTSQKAPGRT